MDDFLTRFVGSPSMVKILRLVIFNPDECFTIDEIASRSQVTKPVARKEINFFEKLGVVKKGLCPMKDDQGAMPNKRVPGYQVNEMFEYLRPLKAFIRDTSPVQHSGITEKLRGAGKLKVVIASGTFVDDATSRVDLLVVADGLNERKLQTALRGIEAEIGRELRYAAFLTDEFRYRVNVYDKLVRDILDYPHHVLLDKLGVTMD
jgi:hypothetical protein